MPPREPEASSFAPRGPALFLAEHPTAYWFSLLAASVALVLFLRRAAASHGPRRWLWLVLSGEQLVQVVGIATLRSSAQRESSSALGFR
jgi:uncharacterized membrane-anchored protein